jgi:hypothetical protein
MFFMENDGRVRSWSFGAAKNKKNKKISESILLHPDDICSKYFQMQKQICYIVTEMKI